LGRKVHPVGFRLGINKDWQAKWYASDPHYAEAVLEDMELRRAIQTKYSDAGISRVDIERQAKEVTIAIHTARPGIVIGRGGQRVEELRQHLEKLVGKKIRLNIREIRQAELDAFLVARSIADQIERRIAYRRAMKQAIFRTMQSGAKGIRIRAAGRLGDAEIARKQIMYQGQVPLQTIRADIDFGFTEAHTTLGRIGIKVWIYKGDIFPEAKPVAAEAAAPEAVAVKPEAAAPVAIAEAPAAKPVEVIVAEAPAPAPAPVAEPKPKPAKKAREVVAATVEEKPAVAAAKPARKARAAAKIAEKPAAAEVKPAAEEKPAKPARKRAVKTEKKPAEAEVKPAAEEKPAPKRRTKAAAPKAEVEATKAKAEPAAEEKPAKPKRTKKTSAEAPVKEKEE
jgi:small subunit ribosomal protein S3